MFGITPLKWCVYVCVDTRGPAVNWTGWRNYYEGDDEEAMRSAIQRALFEQEWEGLYLAIFIDKYGNRWKTIYCYDA